MANLSTATTDDKKAGDVKGDGEMGAWHVVKAEEAADGSAKSRNDGIRSTDQA